MEKKIKSRKQHKCDTCDGVIKKGSSYVISKHRVPAFDDFEVQTGILYLSYKECSTCEKRRIEDLKQIEAFMQTDEYKYSQAMREHRYP